MEYEVTIGIPLYNAERFIRPTLESALAQTFPSIEFLIVDDCGTDGSAEIVKDMQTGHPRGNDIRLVRQPRNMGVGPARNQIIDEARGRYLYFMDADDLIAPETISLLHENVTRHAAEIAFGSYEKVIYKPSGNNDGASGEKELYSYPDAVLTGKGCLAEFAFRKYGGIQAAVWNWLVDLSFLRATGHRFIDASYWEDMVFTYTLTTFVSRAVLLPDVTYSYMCREDSLSNYQRRDLIAKSEVTANVATVDVLKCVARDRLMGRPYLGNWCCNVMMTDFYIICNAIRNRDIIRPAVTPSELRSFMSHPLRLGEILRLGRLRGKNLFLYTLGKLPAGLSVWIIGFLGRRKGLI